ncbi:hypothetical protein SprV_0100357100 [Sparganum proliferum]
MITDMQAQLRHQGKTIDFMRKQRRSLHPREFQRKKTKEGLYGSQVDEVIKDSHLDDSDKPSTEPSSSRPREE